MSLAKPLDAIMEADLQALITDRIAEQQTVDYKRLLYLDAEPSRDEFRADVSSFANASGGHYIVGMEEENGFPTRLCGMDIPNPDALKLRIDDVLQNKVSPRIPGLGVRVLDLDNGKAALVIRVPQSFTKPHQITVNKDDFRFYSRRSAGKYRLSVDELRSIILESDTLTERIRAFRLERLGNIIAGETPVRLVPGARTVLHMIPLNAFNPTVRYDVSALENAERTLLACPSAAQGYTSSYTRHNLDGFYSVLSKSSQEGAFSYLQVFRNGILEGVEAMSINWGAAGLPNWAGHDETLLIKAIERGIALQKHLGVEPPIAILVTLVGVKGYTIYRGQYHFDTGNSNFDRDTLVLPDTLVEDIEVPAHQIVRPILDALWNAGGYARCLNFDATGAHNPPQ